MEEDRDMNVFRAQPLPFIVGDFSHEDPLLAHQPVTRDEADAFVTRLAVEFRDNDRVERPYVKLKFDLRETRTGSTFTARMWMQVHKAWFLLYPHANNVRGQVQVELDRNPGLDVHARAIFEFEVLQSRFTLRDTIAAIHGMHPGLHALCRFDLTKFEFLRIRNLHTSYAGGRDWAAQVFVRLHSQGWVGWTVVRSCSPCAGLDDFRNLNGYRLKPLYPTWAVNWYTVGFHNIIGMNFIKTQVKPLTEDAEDVSLAYQELPIFPGMFGRPFGNLQRRMHMDDGGRYVLPYLRH